MKELSIEEKARKYDEAYKKVAIRFGSNVADEIFSQFEMSEDERIRKWIIENIQETLDADGFFKGQKTMAKNAIAWLEKQGEQKQVIDYSDSFPKDNWELIHEFVNKFGRIPKDEDELNVLIEYVLRRQKPAWSEEVQEEQVNEEFINALGTMLNDGLPDRYLVSEERIKKSAELLFSIARKQLKNEMQEWSEEDVKMIGTLIAIFEVNYPDGFYKVNPIDTTNMQGIHSSEIIKWLKLLKHRIQPQLNQGWSEEDENIAKTIINEFEQSSEWYCANGLTKEDCIAWLSRQMHTKWSEEDKNKVNNLYVLLDQMVSFNMLSNKDATEFKDWLKSLRPQNTWKPSDEQINTLQDAIVYVEGYNSNFKGSGNVLEKLYRDLKKLKE